MITVTVLQQKGGAGKTTLMQMLATAMLDRGGRVHMLDVDSDQQLLDWKARSDNADWDGLKRMDWPDKLTMGVAPKDVEELYETLNTLEESGVELVLIDTRPGAYTDTEDLALAADIILVPSPPKPAYICIGRTILTLGGGDYWHDSRRRSCTAISNCDDGRSTYSYFIFDSSNRRRTRSCLEKSASSDARGFRICRTPPNVANTRQNVSYH